MRKGILAAAIVVCLAAPAGAAATTRYVSQTGVSSGLCTSPDPMDSTNPPCSLDWGYGQTVDGDELILAPGDYTLNPNLIITKAVDIHGAVGQPLPRLIGSASNLGVALVNPDASLRHLEIDYSGPNEALDALASLMVEQVVARSSGGQGCVIEQDTTIRDSVCFDSAPNGVAAKFQPSSGTHTANMRNVTAVATGSGSEGIFVTATNNPDQETLVGKNVIARGVSTDVAAQAGNTLTVATATMSNSNYLTTAPTGIGTATVTPAGTGTNQTGSPLFTDAASGNLHEATGSPTIDAGAVVDLMGTNDFDGDARTLGAAPDIGADEFIPAPPSGTTPPPTSTFNLAAAIKRCKKKFRKGTKARKRCIKKARARAGA
jgi:hypothetical protein